MWNVELHEQDINADPAPVFATDAEIATAERLRHQLEERYFTTAPSPASSPKGSAENR